MSGRRFITWQKSDELARSVNQDPVVNGKKSKRSEVWQTDRWGMAWATMGELAKNNIEAGQVPTTSAFTMKKRFWQNQKLGMKIANSRKAPDCQKL